MNTWHIMPRPVYLLVGDPISTAGMTLRDLETLTQQAHHAIAELYYSRSSLPDLREKPKDLAADPRQSGAGGTGDAD